jgi:hypothetical protein
MFAASAPTPSPGPQHQMRRHHGALSSVRPASRASTSSVVACLSPGVLLAALEPTTGLALWQRWRRVGLHRAVQAALTREPFSQVAGGPPDHAATALLRGMPVVMRPLGMDIMLLGRLFATLTGSSTVRATGLNMSRTTLTATIMWTPSGCVCSALMPVWERNGSTPTGRLAVWQLSMSASSRERNSRTRRRASCTGHRRSSICRNGCAPGSSCASTNPERSDDHPRQATACHRTLGLSRRWKDPVSNHVLVSIKERGGCK